MVSEPERWVADFAAAGASQFTFHIEATGGWVPSSTVAIPAHALVPVSMQVKPTIAVPCCVRATADPVALIERIRATGMRVGVALKPGTPVDTVLPLCDKVDMVLVMTVEPGFGGQKFMPHMMPKVRMLACGCSRAPTLAAGR